MTPNWTHCARRMCLRRRISPIAAIKTAPTRAMPLPKRIRSILSSHEKTCLTFAVKQVVSRMETTTRQEQRCAPSLLTIVVVCGSLTQIVSINDWSQYSTGGGETQGGKRRFAQRKAISAKIKPPRWVALLRKCMQKRCAVLHRAGKRECEGKPYRVFPHY